MYIFSDVAKAVMISKGIKGTLSLAFFKGNGKSHGEEDHLITIYIDRSALVSFAHSLLELLKKNPVEFGLLPS